MLYSILEVPRETTLILLQYHLLSILEKLLTLRLNTLLEVFDSYFNSIVEVFCLISDRPFIVLSPYSLNTGLMVCWSLVNILSPYFLVSILKVLRILPLYLHNTQSVVSCPAPSVNQSKKWLFSGMIRTSLK